MAGDALYDGFNYLVVGLSSFVGVISGAISVGFWSGGLKGRVEALEADNIKCATDRLRLEERVTAQIQVADARLWEVINNFGDLRATVATKDDIALLRQEMATNFAALRNGHNGHP